MTGETKGLNGVTIREVASHAGVSIATVSRALSGTRPMSEHLRERVLTSASELGYQVNLVGRALRKKKTSTLGLIIPDLENPFFSALAQQVSRRFSGSGTDVLVMSADNSIEMENRAVKSFLGRQVEGLVMIPCDEKASAQSLRLASSHVATIQLDRFVQGLDLPFVGCDNNVGIDLVIEHIEKHVDEERQPVIFIGGGSSSSSGRQRLQEFTKFRPDCLVFDGEFSFDWGRDTAQEIISRGITAGTIVTTADVIALGAMSGLMAAGLSIPKDFRVIGFDDVGVSYLANPTLTTISQPLSALTDTIFDFITGETNRDLGVHSLIFAPQLIVRDSSPE